MLDVTPGRYRFGMFLVILVFALIFGGIAAVPLLVAKAKGAGYLESGPGRQLLAGTISSGVLCAVLAYCTWIGQSWARWLTGFLLFAAGVFSLNVTKEYKTGLLAGVAVTIALIALGALLTLAGSIGDFIRVQAYRRRFGITDEPEGEDAES